MIRAVLSKLDLFGTPVVINFSGEEKLKTRFGFYCTLLFLCCMAFILYNGSQEMITHTNPSWVSGDTFTNIPREMVITSANFPFAFGMQASTALNYLNYANDEIFTISVTYDTYYTTTLPNGTIATSSTSIPIILETCTLDHFGDEASVFSNLDLSVYFCIAKNQPDVQELRLQGGYALEIYQTFTAEVFQCNNATRVCADDAEIQKYLEGAYLNVVYANMVIDPSNYDKPDARYQDVYSNKLSRSLYTQNTIQLSHLTVATDNGWVTQRSDTQEYVIIGKTIQDSVSRDSTNLTTPLLSCSFEVSKLEATYKRSYKKLITILAEVGSLANSFLVVVVVFVSPYLKLRLRETLMNRLFDIDTTMEKKSRIQRQAVARERAERQRYMMNRSQMIIAKQRILNKYKYDGDITLTPQHNNSADEKLFKGFGTSSAESIRKERSERNVLENGEEFNLMARRLSHSRNDLKASSSSPGPSLFKSSSSADKQRDTPSPSLSPKKVPENEFNKTNVNEFQSTVLGLAPINEARRKRDLRRSSLFSDKESSKIEMKILEDPIDENLELELDQDQEQDQGQEQAENPPDRIFDTPNGKEDNKSSKSNEDKHGKENDGDQSPNITLKIKNFEEIEKEDAQHMNTEEEDRTLINNLKKKTSSSVNLSFGEYVLSFIYKTKSLKRKLQIINAGRENIGDRLDVVNILKKLREIDKIRALLFDKDQLLLFNNLPKPEINMNEDKKGSNMKKSFSYYVLKDTNIKGEQGTKEQLLEAYRKLKYKESKTELDVRLLGVFDEALY